MSIIQAYNFILNWDHQSSPALLSAIRTVLGSNSQEYIRPLHNCLQAIAEKTNGSNATFFGVPIHAIDTQGRALIGALDRLRVVHYNHFSASHAAEVTADTIIADTIAVDTALNLAAEQSDSVLSSEAASTISTLPSELIAAKTTSSNPSVQA